jgi:hypothetical protein
VGRRTRYARLFLTISSVARPSYRAGSSLCIVACTRQVIDPPLTPRVSVCT